MGKIERRQPLTGTNSLKHPDSAARLQADDIPVPDGSEFNVTETRSAVEEAGFVLVPFAENTANSGDIIKIATDTTTDFITHASRVSIPEQTRGYYNSCNIIIQQRFASFNGFCKTLSETGEVLGVTRERVRQLEKNMMRKLRQLLYNGDFPGLFCRLRPGAKEAWRRFVVQYNDRHFVSVQELQKTTPLTQWTRSPRDGGMYLLMKLMGWYRIKLPNHTLWFASSSMRRSDIHLLYNSIAKVLNDAVPWKTKEQMVEEVRRRLQTSKLEGYTAEVVRCILGSGYYEWQEGRLRLRLEKYSNAIQFVERVLLDKGMPMHHREIVRELHKHLAGRPIRKGGDLEIYARSILIHSPKTISLGKSGYWALSEWGLPKGNLVDIIVLALKKARKPLDSEELQERVCSLRPGTRNESIRSMISLHRQRFARLQDGKYILAEWRDRFPGRVAEKAVRRPLPLPIPDLIYQRLLSMILFRGEHYISKSELIGDIRKRYRINQRVLNRYINDHDIITKKIIDGKQYLTL